MIARRSILGFAAALALTPQDAFAQSLKAFRLKLGDTTIDIDPDNPAEIVLPDGSKTTATLTRNPFVTYTGSNFSFVHAGGLSVSKSQMAAGSVQHMIASALGTIVIVQQYANADPAQFQQMLLNDLTKDTRAAGSQIAQEAITRPLHDGKIMRGLKAQESKPREPATIEVLSYSDTRPGLVVITLILRENVSQDAHILAKFWETFEIK